MDDKDINSDSEDKSITDTIEELFDDFFAPKKTDKTPESKSNQSAPDTIHQKTPVKTPLIKKATPREVSDVKKGSSTRDMGSGKRVPDNIPHKRPLVKKPATHKPPDSKKEHSKDLSSVKTALQKVRSKNSLSRQNSSVKSDRSQPPVKQDAIIKEVLPSSKVPDKKVVQDVPPLRVKQERLLDKAKKGLNPLIFTLLIFVLVISSMFLGGITDIFKIKKSLPVIPEPVTIIKKNMPEVKATKDIEIFSTEESIKDMDAPSLVVGVVKSDIEKPDIHNQDAVKQEEENLSENIPTLLENIIDELSEEPSDVVKGEILSYPYSIYLGSYNSITSIKELSSHYSKMGITSYWIKLDLGEKGVWFRFFAGCFQTKEEADEFIKTRKLQDAEPRLTKYANLIGTYTSEEDIDNQKSRLEELGYSTYVLSDAENVYRLYTGAFTQRKSAEEQKNNLELEGIKSELVER